jgi:hypothetical protein
MRVEEALSPEELAVLKQECDEASVPWQLVAEALVEEHKVFGMGRRHGIFERLDELIRRYDAADSTGPPPG